MDSIAVAGSGEYASAGDCNNYTGTGDTTGSGAAATSTIGFSVDSVTLTGQGLGYRNLPSLEPSTGDATADAQFTPVINEIEGRISSVTIADGGIGYTSHQL